MELFKKLLIFQEETFQARKIEKICSEKTLFWKFSLKQNYNTEI